MAASEFEFRQRFWIIGAIFFFAFLTYNLDHQNAGVALTDWIARVRATAATRADYRRRLLSRRCSPLRRRWSARGGLPI